MKKMNILFASVLLIAVLAMSCTAFADTTQHMEKSKITMVDVEVMNLETGVVTTETMKAGTWYLYATAVYGGENDAYPVAIGANDLYYNETYISAGGYSYGGPNESTSAAYDAYGNKISMTLSYSREVGVRYANRASKTNSSVAPANYAYASTSNATKDFTISFTLSCYKK